MRSKFKKAISLAMAVIMCICMLGINKLDAYAASTVSGNNTIETAYNCGSWTYINSNKNLNPIILEKGEVESWLEFTLAPGEHIYLSSTYSSAYAGEKFEIKNGLGITVGDPQRTPENVYGLDTITPNIYLDCDNDSSSTKTFYLVVYRGTVPIDKDIYFSLSAYNRIRKSSGVYTFSGTASNPGNSGMSLSGVNSSILKLDLTNSGNAPKDAIITRISTSGTQSKDQGGVHHMIMPAKNNTWYTSTVASSDSGFYNISLTNNIPVKQLWSFRYNAGAGAKSTMKNVSLKIDYQYDLNDTGYKLFLK